MKKSLDAYFQKARSWSEDVYLEVVASRNRYRFAFLWCLLIITLFLFGFIVLLPLQHYKILLVHHTDDGTVWVEQLKKQLPKVNRLQIEADIVRYVVNRESYSVSNYRHHYSLVNLLSSGPVSKEYQEFQDAKNPHSPINQFNRRIVRKVRVQNIIFLNKKTDRPLAQVNFTVTDHDQLTGSSKKHALLALISWKYRGAPKDPESQWQNWDGFSVTQYSVQQRNL